MLTDADVCLAYPLPHQHLCAACLDLCQGYHSITISVAVALTLPTLAYSCSASLGCNLTVGVISFDGENTKILDHIADDRPGCYD